MLLTLAALSTLLSTSSAFSISPAAHTKILEVDTAVHICNYPMTGPQPCLGVRKAGSADEFESKYFGIKGFDKHQYGFAYTIEVEEVPVNPPLADGPSVDTKLIRVLDVTPPPVYRTLEIDANPHICNYPLTGAQPCMGTRVAGTTGEFEPHYFGIVGFEGIHQWGLYYEIEVTESPVNPPAPDGPAVETTLVKVLNVWQKPVTKLLDIDAANVHICKRHPVTGPRPCMGVRNTGSSQDYEPKYFEIQGFDTFYPLGNFYTIEVMEVEVPLADGPHVETVLVSVLDVRNDPDPKKKNTAGPSRS